MPPHKLITEVRDQPHVEIDAAQTHLATSGDHIQPFAFDTNNGYVESAAAEVEHQRRRWRGGGDGGELKPAGIPAPPEVLA